MQYPLLVEETRGESMGISGMGSVDGSQGPNNQPNSSVQKVNQVLEQLNEDITSNQKTAKKLQHTLQELKTALAGAFSPKQTKELGSLVEGIQAALQNASSLVQQANGITHK